MFFCFCIVLLWLRARANVSASAGFSAALFLFSFFSCVVSFCFRLMMSTDHRLACRCMAPFLALLSLRCSVHLTARTIPDDSHKG